MAAGYAARSVARNPMRLPLPAAAESALARAAATHLPAAPDERAARLARLLGEVLANLEGAAAAWVARSCESKGIDPASDLAAEEWANGPLAVARAIQVWRRSLQALAHGRLPTLPGRPRRQGDQLAIPVLPALPFDRLVFLGYRCHTLVPADGPVQALPAQHPGVALVLGAGNVTSVPLADLLTLLCRDGQPVLVKLHPLHAPLHEVFAEVFAPLTAVGCAFVPGDADLGQALALDPRVTSVHLTGAPATFARLVAANATRAVPARLAAELGNVTPVVVVPGRFRARELNAQVESVLAMLVNNGSFNCAAARVLVTARRWPQRERFLDRLRARLAAIAPRKAFHPGAGERFTRFAGHAPADPNRLPWTLCTGVEPEAQPLAFAEEAFVPLLHETALDAADLDAFAGRAATFCNERLRGDLAAHVVVDARTMRTERTTLSRLYSALRYGTVAVNTWAGVAFALMSAPWGAAPGNTLDAPGSGLGFVHDPLLLRAPQKTLLEAPSAPWPMPPWWPARRNPRPLLARLLAMTVDPTIRRCLAVVAASLRRGKGPTARPAG